MSHPEMLRRYVPGVLVVAALVVAAVVVPAACGGNAKEDSSARRDETPLPPMLQTLAADPLIQTFEAMTPSAVAARPLTAVTTLDDALAKASHYFFGGEGLALAHPRSVAYVETTVGEARGAFEAAGHRVSPEVADETAAWVFLVYGDFAVQRPIGAYVDVTPSATPPTFGTVVVVIPKDGQRVLVFHGGRRYDLKELGLPIDISSSQLVELCDRCLGDSPRARELGC